MGRCLRWANAVMAMVMVVMPAWSLRMCARPPRDPAVPVHDPVLMRRYRYRSHSHSDSRVGDVIRTRYGRKHLVLLCNGATNHSTVGIPPICIHLHLQGELELELEPVLELQLRVFGSTSSEINHVLYELVHVCDAIVINLLLVWNKPVWFWSLCSVMTLHAYSERVRCGY